MGKKKWCFGREDVICLTKDCPYMSDCIQVVWRRKMARLIGKGAVDGGTIPKLKSSVKKDDVGERDRKKKAVATK
jgi:hypothetical protein